MKRVISFLYFFICALLLFSVTGLAYIDPSAMTYIIQLIAGVAIAGGAAFGFYFRKLKRKIAGRGKEEAVQYHGETDDDKTGLGDYEISSSSRPSSAKASGGHASRSTGDKSRSDIVDPYDESGG